MSETDRPLPPESAAFYRQAMQALDEAGVPFLVAGAFAFARYTGIIRYTKDLDLFIREADLDAALAALHGAVDRTEKDYAHWLAKAYRGDETIDLIYRTANGVAAVDASWFDRAPEGAVLDVEARFCPPEELLWTKAFIMERERYDGADVAHLLRSCGREMDWPRLLRRFGPYWRVLLSHLILFEFIYPGERQAVPSAVLDELVARLEWEEAVEQGERLCRGTLLSRAQYVADVEEGLYRDARLPPHGDVAPGDVAAWTEAAESENPEAERSEDE